MKITILIILVLSIFLLIPYRALCAERYIEYAIHIDEGRSAKWVVSQVVDLNVSVDSEEELQNRLKSLVDAAKDETQREMNIEIDSLKINISLETSSKTVEYVFYWENFSVIEDAKIVVGDVFQIEDFFTRIYGDGELYITYFTQYVIEKVSPLPSKRDDSVQMLKWFRTQDFMNGKPNITLMEKSQTQGFFETLQQNILIILSLIAIASVFSIGFYMFKYHKRRGTGKIPEPTFPLGIESDEEKIVKLLKSSGGNLHQSAIVDHCKFSKAKTSQLLAFLEQKGIVSRYKSGRDKVVTLVERVKE